VPLSLDLDGRVALVTGGTRGVGLGITQTLINAGAVVVTCSRSAVDPVPGSAGHVACDVREPESVEGLVRQVADEHGRLDVLVNNAGGAPYALAADASPRFHAKVVELNLLAPLLVSQAANAVMQQQDQGGAVVMVSSISATRPSPGTAAYGAAKAGLLSLTQTLAVEWAPKVRVNAVTAGMIETELAHLYYGEGEARARVAASVPLGRLGTPRDVADACLFLASPLAAYVSGASLLVHGGGERPAFLDAAKPRSEG
jgi:NAD(P)-dependent dehydrogenase (short-subunit alcohol dehydrogenase family)